MVIYQKTMKYKILILLLILLIGCSKPMECENNTIIINNTIKEIQYINNTIEVPCNLTNTTVKYEYKGTTTRELELIRRISYLEGQQDKYWNYSECDWELNKTEKDLEECKGEICDNWNSSWC